MSKEDVGISYRGRSKERVESARRHLESEDDARLVYACLDLRLAIESLTYDLVKLYSIDLSDSVITTWEPHKLFKELLILDPDADAGLTLTIAGKDGSFEAPDAIEFKEHRLSAKWAQKMHRALGYFLHERLLRELEAGKDSSFHTMRRKVEEAIVELDAIHSSSGFNLRFRQAPKFQCRCGEMLSGFVARTRKTAPVKCGACGTQFVIERTGRDEFRVLEKLAESSNFSVFPMGRWIGPGDGFI